MINIQISYYKQENYRTMLGINSKIASKYVLGTKIGSGSFGEVYVVYLAGTSQIFALKREDEKSKNSQIIIQYKILKQMEGIEGFATVYWQGTQNKFNIIVMEMLGPSLQDLFELCGKSFSLKTTIMIADQMIQRVQALHNRNYIHRDIKPENFLMGINRKSHLVHLIDFGLSKKYRDTKTLQHIPYKQNKNLTGTARYASLNSHLGIEQSRRDDLEAIGYVILYFRQGFLPWQGIKANNKNQKYQKIMQKKMSIPIQVQCKGLPLQISTFFNYCRSLKFDDKPDYNFLRRILRELLEREGQKFDYCYDWTNLQSDRKLDNGKVKIQIKGVQEGEKGEQSRVSNPGQASLQVDDKSRKIQKESIGIMDILASSKKPKIQKNKKQTQEQEEQQQILIGQQNINESGIHEQPQEINRKMQLQLDLQEKKNQLYDNLDIEF